MTLDGPKMTLEEFREAMALAETRRKERRMIVVLALLAFGALAGAIASLFHPYAP